jgi:hypothetical protein
MDARTLGKAPLATSDVIPSDLSGCHHMPGFKPQLKERHLQLKKGLQSKDLSSNVICYGDVWLVLEAATEPRPERRCPGSGLASRQTG